MNTKQLKDKILAMAMRGELVEQDPSEESAEILLEKIKEEKAKLIAEKKIKKEKPLAQIEEDEIPYDLPQGWVWTKLGDISEYIQRGKGPKYSEEKVYPVINQKCVRWGSVLLDNARFINPETIDKYEEIRFLKDKDLLWNSTGTGTVGRIAMYKTENVEYEKVVVDTHVTIVRGIKDNVLSEYILYFLSSPIIQSNLTDYTTGTTNQQELGTTTIKNILIPLPPLAEQKRIVEKIETLFAEVDKLEESRENLDGLKGKLDKKLLDMAMRGELVEQDPTDESAEILLEKIKEEKAKLIAEKKIKKEKPLAPIEEDEIPYNLPQGWVWTRLGEIFEITSSKRVLKEEWTTEGVPFYRAREIVSINKGEELKDPIFISKETYEEKLKVSGEISVGDLLVTGVGTLGVPYLVREKFDFYFKDGNVVWFKNIHNIFSEYVLSFMYSPLFIDTVHKTSKGSTVGTFTIVNAKNILIPLPPLAEQKRIVERLETVRKIINESL